MDFDASKNEWLEVFSTFSVGCNWLGNGQNLMYKVQHKRYRCFFDNDL